MGSRGWRRDRGWAGREGASKVLIICVSRGLVSLVIYGSTKRLAGAQLSPASASSVPEPTHSFPHSSLWLNFINELIQLFQKRHSIPVIL